MKETLPVYIQRKVRNYQPIEHGGLTLFPVLVKEYEAFAAARPALEVLHQSLPVAMMRMPLLSAYYRMDYEAVSGGQPPPGIFFCALLGLALSLRLGEELEPGERVKVFRIVADPQEPGKLMKLQFADADGTKREIFPTAYRDLRRLMAAQNGVELESDEANPDIVQAEKDMAGSGVKLDSGIDTLISAVAALSGADESEIEQWPILKLTKRSEAYRRMLDYLVCGIGEASGTTWKNGNPVPHPFYPKISNGEQLFSSLGSQRGSESVPEKIKQIQRDSKLL